MMVDNPARRNLEKAALRGEPSYVWRAGQERRLRMLLDAAREQIQGRVLENGCGVGMYVQHLSLYSGAIIGLEYDLERLQQAYQDSLDDPKAYFTCAAAEGLPFSSGSFDFILSHEVLEHVQDDRQAVHEMVRVLKPGGRLAIFVPNRGYPFETHGIYWRGRYYFGNIPMVNYLPDVWRNRLAPHVRVYTRGDLGELFADLPVTFVERRIIFGAYDNIIARYPRAGHVLRSLLYRLENTPIQVFGLSHYWVVEKLSADSAC